jgi:hypothetical protein
MKKIVAVAPATSALSMEVVVRVDDGREIILRDGGMQRFVAGDRVRLPVEQPWPASGAPLIDCGCNCVALPRNSPEVRRRENA